MSRHITSTTRLEIDVLEDRLSPSNIFDPWNRDHRGTADEEALIQALERGIVPANAHRYSPSNQGPNGKSNPGVLPPSSHPFGKTYGEWAAAFWQWEFSLPVDNHPLFDTAPASTGQSGHVWFLGGTTASTEGPGGVFVGRAERDATIPSGTALFFPLVNVEASTLEGNGETAAELAAVAGAFADFIDPSSLFVQIDGREVQGLGSFRAQSPAFVFGPLPENNVLQSFGLDAPAGSTSLSVADGYHVMLAPLSVGTHTLHFGGALHFVAPGVDLTFTQDITYHLTVVPR
jgi:hypothetical protein